MSDTTTRARDLARELGALNEKASPRALDRFIDNNAAKIAALLVQLSDELDAMHAMHAMHADGDSVHINILRGMIQLSRMNALHIAGATDYDTMVARINDIHRGDPHVGDVFYALEAGEISIAKAMECVRSYLTTGETGEYAHAKQA